MAWVGLFILGVLYTAIEAVYTNWTGIAVETLILAGTFVGGGTMYSVIMWMMRRDYEDTADTR
jgi:hypothetical protein